MTTVPEQIFKAYQDLGPPQVIDAIDLGLINKTWLVTAPAIKFIVQEVSPIFDTTINEDSDAVCDHLLRYGIDAPKIYRTVDGQRFVSIEGRIFRALKYIDGHSFHTVKSLSMAKSAGEAVGRFHKALSDFSYDYRSKRRHGGDYLFHKEGLLAALKMHRSHDYFEIISPLAAEMLRDIDRITVGLSTTARNAHGDPKISNIIFDDRDKAICLVDFDTLGNSGWSLEMGDAMRSWCNQHREDSLEAAADLKIAEAALLGYGSVMRGFLSKKEVGELIAHSQAITLCLAMRYLADVLHEKYWAFDKKRFIRPADHNLLRAQAMHKLFLDFYNKRGVIQGIASDLLL